MFLILLGPGVFVCWKCSRKRYFFVYIYTACRLPPLQALILPPSFFYRHTRHIVKALTKLTTMKTLQEVTETSLYIKLSTFMQLKYIIEYISSLLFPCGYLSLIIQLCFLNIKK